jgi:tetratricopeptide (TPR) repeat protein
MSKIVISDDKSLESLEIRFDHLLLNNDELKLEKEKYRPLSLLLDNVPDDFVPALLIDQKIERLREVLEGNDELELFFMIMVLKEQSGILFEKIRSLKNSMDPEKYLDMLIFLLMHDKSGKDVIVNEIKSLPSIPSDGVTDLVLSAYSDDRYDIRSSGSTVSYAAMFFEAMKAESANDNGRAFSIFLELFEKSGYHRFIYEILKLYLVRHNDIDPAMINEFIRKVGESPLNVSYSNLKFLEFLYYYRNKVEDKLESTVSSLAESTDSLYILSAVTPLLFKYEKWHLVGKYYKLVGRKTAGSERTKYLELLADIYENKLDMPDFATEIHKTIVEDDPMSCSVSLSRVLSVYEENGQWSDLCDLYKYLAGREEDRNLKAYYFYKAGDVLHRELKKSIDAKELLEKSLSFNHSFEVVRTLSEIYLKLHDYDSYLKTLLKELEFSLDKNERIRLLNIIAETYMDKKKDFLSAEKYLASILEISSDHLPTIKKLGKIYYRTKSWKKLTEINTREMSLIEDSSDRINLLYRNGCIYLKELGDLENAAASFMSILEIETDHVPSLLYLEKIYLRKRDFTNLIVLYKKLLESSGSDSETRQYYLTRLGIIYRDNKMRSESIQMFRKVLEMFPDNIMAKENLRMLGEEADFSALSSGSFDDREIEMFAELQQSGDPGIMAEQYLKRGETSFWKYLYFLGKEDKMQEKVPGRLNNEEQFVLSLLDGHFKVENLLKNSSKRIALMALVEKYIEEGYYGGVYTVLKYYLDYEPEHKRKVWAVFFRGQDNPELIEDLENILVNDSDSTYFDIVREILEKLYLKDENYATIMFLRTVFAKKIEDVKEKCDFLDKTIEEFSDKAPPDQISELYKMRFKFTPQEDVEQFGEKYLGFLEVAGRKSTMISVFEDLWQKNRTPGIGKRYFDALIEAGSGNAPEIAKEVLDMEWSKGLFEKLISIYKEKGEFDAAISEINKKMETLSEPSEIEEAREMLTDIHIVAGYIESAMELYKKTVFSDPVIKFEKGFQLAELLENRDHNDESLQLVSEIEPANEEQSLRKIKVLVNAGYELKDGHLMNIDSLFELKSVIGEELFEKGKEKLVTIFAEKGDVYAAKLLIEDLINSGEKDEAVKKIKTFGFESYDEAVYMSKVHSIDGDTEKESGLLRSILFKAVLRKDVWPLKRLLETGKKNRKTVGLLKCLIKSVEEGSSSCEPTGLAAIDKSRLFDLCGFDETDLAIREYTAAVSFGSRDEGKMPYKPLDVKTQKILFDLLEEIRLATGFEDVNGLWDEKFEGVFEIVSGRIPSLVFGEKTVLDNWNAVRFDIIRNAFLLESGMSCFSGIKGVEETLENIKKSLVLEGKEKVRFIKGLRPHVQNRVLELFKVLENVSEEKFRDYALKLYESSFFHAFSFAPDLYAVSVYLGEPLSEAVFQSVKFRKFSDFIEEYFFDAGAK